jgi:DNA-binding MarR family transcriptional regulator
MTVPNHAASAQFLRETEIRRGFELLYFGHSNLWRVTDAELEAHKLGRAHYRALYFIARKPSLSVSELLRLLAVTKQSLGRVLGELAERGLVESRSDDRDARKRLLRLTPEGKALEARLYQLVRERLAKAYQAAGPEAVAGFWTVLESLIPDSDRTMIRALGER